MSGMQVISLLYDPHDNTIIHEDGRVLDDISNLITHKELAKLKKLGGTLYLEGDEDDVIYELEAPIPDDEFTEFYYDLEENVITDCRGQIVFNIFAFISPQDLMMFKKNKKDIKVYGVNGGIVCLFYPIDDEDDYTYNF